MATESKLTTITAVAAIARALGHGCAIDAEEAEQAVSLRHLNALMRARAIGYNDRLARNEQWASCPEGWGEDENAQLSWQTHTGRLEVWAHNDGSIRLAVNAGPSGERPASTVCGLTLLQEWDKIVARVTGYDESLTRGEDRRDRLDILMALGPVSEIIVTGLRQQAELTGNDEPAHLLEDLQLPRIYPPRGPWAYRVLEDDGPRGVDQCDGFASEAEAWEAVERTIADALSGAGAAWINGVVGCYTATDDPHVIVSPQGVNPARVRYVVFNLDEEPRLDLGLTYTEEA